MNDMDHHTFLVFSQQTTCKQTDKESYRHAWWHSIYQRVSKNAPSPTRVRGSYLISKEEVKRALLSKELLWAHSKGSDGQGWVVRFRTHGPNGLKCKNASQNYQQKSAYLDGFSIKLKPFLFVYQKFLDVFALITLELNYLSHLSIVNNSAIASW